MTGIVTNRLVYIIITFCDNRFQEFFSVNIGSNPLLSLVGYSSDASSDEDSDNDKPDRKSPTPDEDHRQENGHKSVIDHDIPLPDEAESSVAQEPIKGTETGKVAEPVASGSVLEIPLPPSSTPAPQGDANFSIDSEVANFLAVS